MNFICRTLYISFVPGKNEIALEIWTFDIHLRKRTNILTYIKPFREILIFRLMWQIPYNVTFKKKKKPQKCISPGNVGLDPASSLSPIPIIFYPLSTIYNPPAQQCVQHSYWLTIKWCLMQSVLAPKSPSDSFLSCWVNLTLSFFLTYSPFT